MRSFGLPGSLYAPPLPSLDSILPIHPTITNHGETFSPYDPSYKVGRSLESTLRESPVPQGGDPGKIGSPSKNEILAIARQIVDTSRTAISGKNGHHTLYVLCLNLVKGLSLSQDEAFGLILSRYNHRCQEPWTDEEIRHKLRDAANSNKVGDGYLLKGPRKTKREKATASTAKPEAWKLQSFVNNAPLDLIIPGAWKYQDGGITQTEGGGDPSKKTFPKLSIPTGRIRDLDTNGRLLQVSWLTGQTWNSIVADRSAFKDRTAIVRLADRGFPAASHTAGILIQFLDDVEVLNEDLIPETVSTSHLGWHRVDGQMYFQVNAEMTLSAEGSACFTFQAADQGERQIAMAPGAMGTMAEWQRGIQIILKYPKVILAVHTALASVLLEPLGHQVTSFSVSYEHRTSAGKTTSVLFGLSIFFRPAETGTDSPLVSFDSTQVGLERRLAILHSLPAAIDDTKRAKNPQQVAEIPYLITQGIGRGRGTKNGLDRLRGWKLSATITGEAPLGSYTQNGGAHARVIPVRGAPFGTESADTADVIAAARGILAENYGHAGPLFVRHLLDEYKRDGCESLRNRHRDLTEEFGRHSSNGGIQRMATFAAALHLAGDLAHGWGILPGPFTAPMKSIWKEILAEAEDPSGESRALLSVLDWARANPQRFQEYSGEGSVDNPASYQGWAGYWLLHNRDAKPNQLGFFPHVLESVLRDLGYDPPGGILNGWRDLGYLVLGEQDAAEGKRRLAKQVRIKGGLRRLIVINLSKAPIPGGFDAHEMEA